MTGGFGDRLATRVAERRSQIVLGLDPDPARLWPRALEPPGGAVGSSSAPPGARAAQAVRAHCEMVLDATAGECVAAKLQVACFERLGAEGWRCLADVAAMARDRGLLVIADAKRGDIDVSARAYAQAFLGVTDSPFGPIEGLGADALTVNPLLGRDSLEPFVATARERGRGVFVLVRTSNPGAADVQELALREGGDVSRRLAGLVAAAGRDGVGLGGLSDVGAVVGATAASRLAELRELMPQAVLLLPGVGAQGAGVAELAAAFVPGQASALITASRSIVFAAGSSGGDPAEAARREASWLREEAWRLAG